MSIYYLGPWLADQTYKHAQKLILLAIANCVNEQGVGFISQQMICDTAGVSEEYVRRSLRQFSSDGVLEILEPPARGRATVYRLSLPTNRRTEVKDGSNRTDVLDVSLEDGVGGNEGHSWGQTQSELGAIGLAVGGNSVGGNSVTFDAFWEVYPRKAQKQAAKKAWAKAIKLASAAEIISGAERLAADPNLPDKQFVPHPATWLNAGGWDDEPLPPRAQHHRGPSAATVREQERAARLNRYREMDASDGWAITAGQRALEGA